MNHRKLETYCWGAQGLISCSNKKEESDLVTHRIRSNQPKFQTFTDNAGCHRIFNECLKNLQWETPPHDISLYLFSTQIKK